MKPQNIKRMPTRTLSATPKLEGSLRMWKYVSNQRRADDITSRALVNSRCERTIKP